jgi:hypothetical protein
VAKEWHGAADSSGDGDNVEWKIQCPLGRIRSSHDRIYVG